MSNRISPEHMAEIKAMTRGVLPSQLLEHIDALEAENERLNQLSVDLRACMFEARHKWGLEQDKNDKLWAVAKAVGLVPVPQEHAGMVRIHSRDWWNIADALAALDEEVD